MFTISKKLVAYFSASGNTEKLAMKLTEATGADLHAIEPVQKYTAEDLNWNDADSRSSIEMKNKSSRPEIKSEVDNIRQYDTIYVGFPIWWHVAPTIINTFLEQYDITGKVIIPFATSGGGNMGNTNEELKNSCKGAILKNGKVFGTNVSEGILKEWSSEIERGI